MLRRHAVELRPSADGRATVTDVMARRALYSRSPSPTVGSTGAAAHPARRPAAVASDQVDNTGSAADSPPYAANPPPATADASARAGRWRRWRERGSPGLRLLAAVMVGVLLGAWVQQLLRPNTPRLTQRDIDAAVLRTLENEALPSPAAKAWEVIRPSLVRVRRLGPAKDGEPPEEIGVGSGVVVLETGLILTNLHVVAGADSVKVVFADGLESDADVVKVQPDQDLAVLQARTLPDDLPAATLKSTADVRPGDTVVAAGFPFGIGPSVTSGVVSGLKREFRSPEGKQILTNLIQFDAAVNPGSSGGPLMTPEGEVIGIVTAVLNPTEQRVFVGIGFAVPIESAAAGAGMSPF